MASELVERYFRKETLPNIWCPGCSNGIVTSAIVRAIDNLGLDQNKVCIVSGIGCSARASGYLDFNTLHTTHGRAIAFATGIKFANPELTVIVITGDGDNAAIGGNHFIHACRRNIDLTVVMYNNHIYGMTGGQYSPTTPRFDRATTTPYGNIDRYFDICKLAIGAGATYVARGTAYHVQQLTKLIERGISHKGFSFIEALSICPTYYGRKNKKGTPADMLKWLKDHAVDIKQGSKMDPEEFHDKFIIGELLNIDEPEFVEEYQKMLNNLKVNYK
ncbi:2-oxoacid:ferredoxin oxidoreductase subunit beta [Thermoanaerobacter thermohydrosulfuricus]|uniref:Thiamine pyrophosphate TPP-binding domain-containing protein n=1 Tax=Thermoanaerobacter thermohydrosulfuricus WC1 TaxID=1198630 RepID=M8D0Q4_THETY|nr:MULTISPECIES: 2-oxoacid:ferredoxin oxidoreductase subunit beta [Thermoanaerobacter]EMT40123.1 thiamine pyrophosphate TPP-binding domain-containing protein [Thermoanaerobacter thermohydrosulfuricus WC1]UZQ84154.1 2-oxoacid:ferredoxin oxidoreductase subunit beta [Thermoanaerobacter sp. RKWS2]